MKKIIFRISNIENWIGGIYYVKNIINLLMHSERIKNQYQIHLWLRKSQYPIFAKYKDAIVIIQEDVTNKWLENLNFLNYVLKNNVDYWYCTSPSPLQLILSKRIIFWIPDFQYLHLPALYSEEVIKKTNDQYKRYARKKNYLILSSEDSKRDFIEHFPGYRCKCEVVHFTSDIEDDILQINENREKEVLTKYGLDKNSYIYVPNQFWQHKNHVVVLEMIESFYEYRKDIAFVFTGQMEESRNSWYLSTIKEMFTRPEISAVSKVLGFLDRDEQLIIMKNALFLIQPSLFEGWGTVLEDAKVLDKRVILSDINVHYEQKYEKCKIFKRNDAKDLLDAVRKTLGEDAEDNVTNGLQRYHEESISYVSVLEKVLL